ncbi:MAG: BACON domain-containing protein, partial [Alistipes sp.]|nr:BACON domain-containing protein [Alistipes sp.]
MRKLFSLMTLLAVMTFVGCENKGGDEGVTSFTLAQTELEVSADGGVQSVAYTIKNPQQGAVVLTNCKVDWIKELSTATVGEVKFTVMPNYTSEARETTITVQYTALEERYELKVKQAANDKPRFAFEVAVNEPTRLSINVTPADLSTAYICRAYSEAHIDLNNLYEDELLADYDMEAIEYEAYYAGQTVLNYLQNISHTGKGYDIEFTKLTPDTNYVVYAYHIDLSTGEICSDIYRHVVRTAAPETAEFEFEMEFEVSGAVITQTITPADKEVYYYTYRWSVEEFYMYYGFSAVMEETLVTKWNEQMMAWVQNGYQPYQIVDQNCFKGDKVIEHTDLKAETDYVFYIFAVDRETGLSASDITIVEKRTNKAHASDMTIEIVAKNIFQTTADVYWTASDPNGKFARSVFTKEEFDALGANDEEKLETCLNEYGFYEAYGYTDMNLTRLQPNTTYVAFAYGLDGEAPNTRIFKHEFKTLSDTAGTSNISIKWDTHYNLAKVAAVDTEHWGDYAEYEDYALVEMAISGVSATDEVYMWVTTMPIDYYNTNAEWLRDVAQQKNRVNCYTNYNYVAEYEREYTVVAVAKDKNGNYGQL